MVQQVKQSIKSSSDSVIYYDTWCLFIMNFNVPASSHSYHPPLCSTLCQTLSEVA